MLRETPKADDNWSNNEAALTARDANPKDTPRGRSQDRSAIAPHSHSPHSCARTLALPQMVATRGFRCFDSMAAMDRRRAELPERGTTAHGGQPRIAATRGRSPWSEGTDLPRRLLRVVVVHDDVGVISRAGGVDVELLGGSKVLAAASLDCGGVSEQRRVSGSGASQCLFEPGGHGEQVPPVDQFRLPPRCEGGWGDLNCPPLDLQASLNTVGSPNYSPVGNGAADDASRSSPVVAGSPEIQAQWLPLWLPRSGVRPVDACSTPKKPWY